MRKRKVRPLLVTVLTCPRPHGASYLAETLAGIGNTGDVRVLICDGPLVDPPSGWKTAVVPPRERSPRQLPDNKVPGWVALRTAWLMGADLLFCEDDIYPLRTGAFTDMAAHQVPNGAAWTSFFASLRGPGIFPAASFQMSQAMKLPWRSLGPLVEAVADPQVIGMTGVDLALAAVGQKQGWVFEQTPNLVEHIGFYSAANPH